jgi:small subunit ribosomal protein S18
MRQQNNHRQQPVVEHCHFCLNRSLVIDYKDVATMRKFISSYGKIAPRRRSGVCSPHQRQLAMAIKRARIMALMPFLMR